MSLYTHVNSSSKQSSQVVIIIFVLLARRLRLGELICDFSKDLKLLSSGVGLVPNTEAQVLSIISALLASWNCYQSTRRENLAQGPSKQGILRGHLAMSGDVLVLQLAGGCYWHLEARYATEHQRSGHSPQQRTTWSKMSIVPRSRNPAQDGSPWPELLS